MVKNPPSNAGDVGLIPGWGTKIPHAMGKLSSQLEKPTGHNEHSVQQKPKQTHTVIICEKWDRGLFFLFIFQNVYNEQVFLL